VKKDTRIFELPSSLITAASASPACALPQGGFNLLDQICCRLAKLRGLASRLAILKRPAVRFPRRARNR
jgi:hypothetical protein